MILNGKAEEDPGQGVGRLQEHRLQRLCHAGRRLRVSSITNKRQPSIFTHPAVKELVNLQNVDGQVKPYQMRQFMDLVERYDLTLEKQP